MIYVANAKPADRTKLKLTALAVLGLASSLSLYSTAALAAAGTFQSTHDAIEEICEGIGGQFVEVSDNSYACLVDSPGLSMICTAGGTCHTESLSPEAAGGKKPGAPKPLVDADLSPDSGTSKGGLTPKTKPAVLSPQ